MSQSGALSEECETNFPKQIHALGCPFSTPLPALALTLGDRTMV